MSWLSVAVPRGQRLRVVLAALAGAAVALGAPPGVSRCAIVLGELLLGDPVVPVASASTSSSTPSPQPPAVVSDTSKAK